MATVRRPYSGYLLHFVFIFYILRQRQVKKRFIKGPHLLSMFHVEPSAIEIEFLGSMFFTFEMGQQIIRDFFVGKTAAH